MMFWYGGHWVFWQVALMGVAMVVFWGLVVWAIWAFVTRRSESGRAIGEDAAAILDRRLASGELGAEEYRRLRALLRGEAPTSAGAASGPGPAGESIPGIGILEKH